MKAAEPGGHLRRVYRVRHVTRYTYTDDVTASYARACLRPRDTQTQTVLDNEIRIDPSPEAFTEHVDLFGNFSHYIEVHSPHRTLLVTKRTVLAVERPAPELEALDRWTVSASPEATGEDPTLLAAYRLPSTLVDLGAQVRDYAERVMSAQAPLGRSLAALVTAIHADFRYAAGATDVGTTLPELLARRAGVCQDFAHLAIGCLRSMGLAARYVSGYLETVPPPGQAKLRGADATHAWVSVHLPDGRWLDLDPTNDCAADSRYVVTGWGRDYRDVAPLKGVIFTEGATASLDVNVDVERLDETA